MKVLLVQNTLGRPEICGPIFPIGLCYIATALENAGHSIKLLDMNLYEDCHARLADIIQSFKPDIIGISQRNIDTTSLTDYFPYHLQLRPTLDCIRSVTTATIMIGGAGYSMFPKKIMDRNPDIAFGVYLEGEDSVVELLDNLENPKHIKGIYFREGDIVVYTGKRAFPKMSSVMWPKRHYAEVAKYNDELSMGVQSMRGCPLGCVYCNYPMLNGKKLRRKTVKDTVDEIEYLHQTFDVDTIIFTDSVLNIIPSHVSSLCHELIQRKIKIRWSGWFDIYKFTRDDVELAINAGCFRMSFSPDAASDRTLKSMGKRIREVDLSAHFKMIKDYSQLDLRYTLFCSPPEQDFRDIIQCVKFFFRTHVWMRNSKCLISWIRLFPDTKVYNDAIEKGALSSDVELLPENEDAVIQSLFYGGKNTHPLSFYLFRLLIPLFEFLRQVGKVVVPLKR